MNDSQAWCLMTDDDLMARLEAGQAEPVMVELQRRYAPSLGRLLHGMVRDEWLAQDLLQEVFVKVFCKSHLYHRGTQFRSWIHGIARNHGLSALRRRRLQPIPVSSLSTSDELPQFPGESIVERDPGVGLEEAEFMAAFHRAVAELPDRYRSIFERCVVQGETYREVAEDMGIPAGTVAIRVSRARRRLFEALSHHLGELRDLPACVR